ncbi:MAG: HlyD family secretion protein [Nannocystales bacterium]
MTEQQQTPPKRVATPAFLHQRLMSYRLGKGASLSYVVRDTVRGTSHDFEPWQFFTLEVLPGCEDETKLATVFEDRFGQRPTRKQLNGFFGALADAGLFNDAAGSHPLLSRFTKKTYDVVEGEAVVRRHSDAAEESGTPVAAASKDAAASAVRPTAPANSPAADETLPAGMQDAVDFDARTTPWSVTFFNPTFLLRWLSPLLAPLRFVTVLLPLTLLAAFALIAQERPALEHDLRLLLGGMDLFDRWLISLLTVNLCAVWTTATAAHRFRATVHGFGLALVMRVYPRFVIRVGYVDQLSRTERMWLHAAPLIARLVLFDASIFLWYLVRGSHPDLASLALAVSMTGVVSFLFTANPLLKGSGYHLVCAFSDEPRLRGKAFKTLLSKIRGGVFQEANELLLVGYAVVTAVFIFSLAVGAAVFIATVLHRLQLGGSAIIVATVVGFVLIRRMVNYGRRIEAAYDRSVQFDRWRRRVHHEDEPDPEVPAPKTFAAYVWRASTITFFVVMFLPYPYQPGGEFVVHPSLQQEVTTDVSGRIAQVYFDGGEEVAKGTVVARLANDDAQAQIAILDKKIDEQRAVLDDLAALPRPEDVRVAKMALDVEKTRTKYSRIQLKRVESLAKQGVVGTEELDDALRQVAVDEQQKSERGAELAVARLGPTPYEVAEAEAKLATLNAERDAYVDRIRRSELLMPFDGRLLTMFLREKGNSYYTQGEVFAMAEASGQMTAEIEIPESEAEHVEVGSRVRLRSIAYSSEVFTGTVVQIDWVVSEKTFGNVIKVLAKLDDPEGRLKNGMSGYAKLDGPSLLVWEAFSQELFRFVELQVWSWIP